MKFEPANDLERSLMRAATDPAHRPQFYRDFLASEVFTLTGGPLPGNHGQNSLNAGDQVPLLTLNLAGKKVLPIFSSLVQVTHFMRVEGSEGINGHFRSGVKPFYERKIFGIF